MSKSTEKPDQTEYKRSDEKKIKSKVSKSASQKIKQNLSQSNKLESKSSDTNNKVSTKDDIENNSVSNMKKDENSIQEKCLKLEEKIKETVKDILNLSDQEINDLVLKLGIQFIDLLNQDTLKTFVLEASGNELTDLLTNETLVSSLSTISESILSIDLEKDFSLTEDQLTKMIEEKTRLGYPTNKPIISQGLVTDQSYEKVVSDTKKDFIDLEKTDLKTDLKTDSKELIIKVERSTTDTASNDQKITTNLNLSLENSNLLNGSNDNKENHQDTNFKNLNATDTFINHLVDATNVSEDFTTQIANLKQMREIVTQIVEQIKITIKPENTNMQLQLNPENLGKVNLSITSHDGIMTAQFIVENEAAREAIESQIHNLRDVFQQQNLTVEAVEITVSNFGFSQSNQADTNEDKRETNKKKINLDDLDNLEVSLSEEQVVENEIINQNGNVVDYTA